MKTLMIIVMFLFVGAFFIISNDNIKLDNADNIGLFFKEYALWIDSLFGNGKVVGGYVVKMEWLPDEGKTP